MAKTNKKTGNNTVTKKTTSFYEPVTMTNNPGTENNMPSNGSQATTGTGILNRPAVAGKPHTNPVPTHKQIEDMAKEIWRRKGCPSGQDEKNWLEAEAQLKKEMGIK